MIDMGLSWKSIKPMIELPSYLGNHTNKINIDKNVLDYLVQIFNIKTVYDVGCGSGGMMDLFNESNLKATGIDGDYTLLFPKNWNIIIHDFTMSAINLDNADLSWCCGFLENVDEKYIDNYFSVFYVCKIVCCTFSLNNGVNCKNQDYWNNIFYDRGFILDKEKTNHIRNISSMDSDLMKTSGSLYINSKLMGSKNDF